MTSKKLLIPSYDSIVQALNPYQRSKFFDSYPRDHRCLINAYKQFLKWYQIQPLKNELTQQYSEQEYLDFFCATLYGKVSKFMIQFALLED